MDGFSDTLISFSFLHYFRIVFFLTFTCVFILISWNRVKRNSKASCASVVMDILCGEIFLRKHLSFPKRDELVKKLTALAVTANMSLPQGGACEPPPTPEVFVFLNALSAKKKDNQNWIHFRIYSDLQIFQVDRDTCIAETHPLTLVLTI